VTIWLLWASKTTEPPHRTVTLLASPDMSAVLPSVAVTVLLLPILDVAELLLVALTVLKFPLSTRAVLPSRAMLVFPVLEPKPACASLLLSAIAVFSSPLAPA
jgi:hypothetical protein